MIQDLVKQHISSVILTGAVAAISAYVLWGGDNKTGWKKGKLRPSLENLGNTCFLNCVTQALSSVESFYAWIQDILQRSQDDETSSQQEFVITEELKRSAPMISALFEVLTTLQQPTDGTQSTSLNKVHRAMSEHGWDTLFTQEDAYEAFQVLITSIEREASMLLPLETPSPVPVQGKFLTLLQCVECRTDSSCRIEPFDNITLHLSRRQSVTNFTSLRDMLHSYFSPESVSDVECENCSLTYGITTTCEFRRQVKIAKAPKCLCIQISRTEFDNGSMTKNNEHVSFPVGSLDLTLFAYQALLFSNENDLVEQEPGPAVSRAVDGFEVVRSYDTKEKDPPMIEGLNYTLKSVIVHHGTANAGHYVTYRKINDAQWLYASDDVVRLATRDELERQQIYLLYYERRTLPEVLNQTAGRTRDVTTPVAEEERTINIESYVDKMSPPLILSPGLHSPPVLLTPPNLEEDLLQDSSLQESVLQATLLPESRLQESSL